MSCKTVFTASYLYAHLYLHLFLFTFCFCVSLFVQQLCHKSGTVGKTDGIGLYS